MVLFQFRGAFEALLVRHAEQSTTSTLYTRESDPEVFGVLMPKALSINASSTEIMHILIPKPSCPEDSTLYVDVPANVRSLARACLLAGKRSSLKVYDPSPAALRFIDAHGTFNATANPSGKAPTVLENLCLKFGDRAEISLAIIHPFARAIGDSLVFCTMLRILREQLNKLPFATRVVLVQSSFHPTQHIYDQCTAIDSIVRLPILLSDLSEYDAVIDLSARVVPFSEPFLDGLLKQVGIDPAAVPLAEKRNRYAHNVSLDTELDAYISSAKRDSQPCILVNHAANDRNRAMPAALMDCVLRRLLAETNYCFVVVSPSSLRHRRIFSALAASTPFNRLAAALTACDGFVSVDTSLLHLADALRVPGIGIFSVIPSRQYLPFYPQIRGIDLSASPYCAFDSYVTYSDVQWDGAAGWAKVDGKKLARQIRSGLALVLSGQSEETISRGPIEVLAHRMPFKRAVHERDDRISARKPQDWNAPHHDQATKAYIQ